ncbi:unnamed protein product [Schistosoma margrebowiei]|uniref:Uncharacterized protein n=1 Tax=Schistosoma margrebowiei TaxID=48269 RepID=A0A183LMA3_9TREM|nr:unnamed protein product [Schistosoma margrebowiei]
MQVETISEAAFSSSVDLNIHKGKPRSSNATRRTTQSQLVEELWKTCNLSRTRVAISSMDEEDSMPT